MTAPIPLKPPKHCYVHPKKPFIETRCPVYDNTQLVQSHQRSTLWKRDWPEHRRSKYVPHEGAKQARPPLGFRR